MRVLLSCALLVCVCPAQTDPPEDARRAKMEALLACCAGLGWSGSALVAHDGEVVLQAGYGAADRATGQANTPETLFEIASLTKQFTAAAILKLEEQGKLSTDDPITEHLPGVPESCQDITILDLLTHTTGMPRHAGGGHGDDLAKAVAGYFATPRSRPRGERFEYWNGGYALLAGIVETVTGGRYVDYCREHLFEPAGMVDSGFTGDAHLRNRPTAIGYTPGQPARSALDHPYGSYGWQYRGMGGAVNSVLDLYRWDRALRDDTVLEAKARDKMFTPRLSGYACGWFVIDTSRGTRQVSHSGGVRGFNVEMLRFPDDHAAVIVTSNASEASSVAVAGLLASILFDEKPKFPLPPDTVELESADLDAVAGRYELSPGNRFVVRRAEGGIMLGAEGQDAMNLLLPYPARPGHDESHSDAVQRAVTVTEKVGAGDVEMLRQIMLPHIPADWPDRIKAKIWPAHLEKWGALRGVRALGAKMAGFQRVEVALALDHDNGSARCRVAFQGDELSIFDLNGPEFASSFDYLPASKTRFVRYTWIGPQPQPLVFERGEDGAFEALLVNRVLGKPQRCARVN